MIECLIDTCFFNRDMARALPRDALIGAAAVVHGVPAYTADRKDFERFPVQVVDY